MKKIALFLLTLSALSVVIGQTKKTNQLMSSQTKVQIVEASCGECKFGMKGKSCDLAVRINGKSYFVDGTKIDDHGDAHSINGFCQKIRKAEVKGSVVNNRFVASYFKLLPEEKSKN